MSEWRPIEDLVRAFVAESNRIEGIVRRPYKREVEAVQWFMALPTLTITDVTTLQAVFAPGKPLRDQVGMNVRVGSHIAPAGGPAIADWLREFCAGVTSHPQPYLDHHEFETWHPFMDGNGRTGRAIWAWEMWRIKESPFGLPFLHRFYYQTLEHGR